jgi:hypothetical protein
MTCWGSANALSVARLICDLVGSCCLVDHTRIGYASTGLSGGGRQRSAQNFRWLGIANGRFRIKPWSLIEEPRTAGYGASRPLPRVLAKAR